MAGDAVDVRRRQPGVRQRRRDGPQREGQRADAGVLGEVGVADARDRRAVAQLGPAVTRSHPVDPRRVAVQDLLGCLRGQVGGQLGDVALLSGHRQTLCG